MAVNWATVVGEATLVGVATDVGDASSSEASPVLSSSQSDDVARRTMSAALAAALRGGGRSPRLVGEGIEGGLMGGLMTGPVGESSRVLGLGGSVEIWPTPGGRGRMETVMLVQLGL